jgi:acetylornithine/succinyldiaminopimelate/putrescine aminotransferase
MESLLPGEDRTCWPAGAVALAARGARIQVRDPAHPRPRWLYDLICGYGAFNFGHAPAGILRTLARELRHLDGCAALPSEPAERLARRLVTACGFARGMAYFSAGGSQAVEIALRIGRMISGRPRVAAVTAAFHGYGAETIQLSRDFVGHDQLEGWPGASDVVVLPWNEDRAFARLREAAPETGTLVLEPVLGAAGFRMPSARWFRRLLEEARALGMFTILDEIQVGMGRTGRLLSVEHLLPAARRRELVDAVTLSKSLAGGVWPLSAVVINGARHAALADLNDRASLGETFSNNPAACAAAHAALDLVGRRRDALLARVRASGRWLQERLERRVRALALPGVAARGGGLALALAFADTDTARRFVGHAWDERLLCYVSGGRRYSCVKLIPPLTVTQRDLAAIEAALGRALDALAGSARGGDR